MMLYSMEAFLEVLVDYNQAIWPGQLTAFFLCALLLGLLLWPRKGSDRVIAGFLALGWLWTGLVFMDLHLIRLNWTARYFGVVFGIQGLLLIWSGTIKDRLRFQGDVNATSWFGLGLVLFALIIYPLAQIAVGIDWMAVQYAGLGPTPTVILTMGVLLLCRERIPIHLMLIPVVWSSADGATAWRLGLWWDLSLPVAGLLSVFFSITRLRNAPQPRN